MQPIGTTEVLDGIGVLTIDNPPVNALSAACRRALDDGFGKLAADASVRAIVLICAGRTFFAGADISEFGKPPQEPSLKGVFDILENGTRPVVAAIHGTALGGGYELALACHYRIAVPSAKVGLPEVKLGLMPGAGGTQRLPRIVGIPAALDLITGGAPVAAPQALELGMIDALANEGSLRADAIAFARKLVSQGRPLVRVRDREDKVLPWRGRPEIYADYLRKNARAFRGFRAPFSIVAAIEAAAERDFDSGLAYERDLFFELKDSPESAAQRYYFFAEREAAKVPDLAPGTRPLPVGSVAIVGAGTMGGGIAMAFANAGLPVALIEVSRAALDRGLGIIRRNYEGSAAKGRMTPAEVEERMARIAPAVDLGAAAGADLVIEAVYEDMATKQELFAALDGVAKPGAILASNTSYLDLDAIAGRTARPESVIGLHFFSPANVMRLLEIVRGRRTSDAVLATALALARTIGKVPVVSRVGPGFIANRVMSARRDQALQLLLEGTAAQEIDRALEDFGFAMGPFAMSDLVGLDVLGRGASERTLQGDLVKLGRLGQKQGGGYYDYDEQRRPAPSPIAERAIADFARFRGIARRPPQPAEAIVRRLLAPVVNEGAKLLAEGIAIRASDIDVACILGYNWPVYTGGPMFWADAVGLPQLVGVLREIGVAPAPLLADKAAVGGGFTRG